MKRIHGKLVFEMSQMIIGNALSAFAVACFALPYEMVVSGLSGIGRIINYYTGLSVTLSVYLFSAALFLLGLVALGKKFAATILLGSLTFPIFFDIFRRAEMLHHLVEDPLLAAICAGILDGIGIGLVLRAGGSTGGIDVPPIILNRKYGWKIAPMIYSIDVAIFLLQLAMTSTNGVILGILYALIYSVVMNRIIVIGQGGIQLMIFSKKSDEINECLIMNGYGTSLIQGTGGYLREAQDIIYCITSGRNLNRVKKAVLDIDERAFITIGNVNEVNGNGFTSWFNDQDYVPDINMRREGTEDLRGRQAIKAAEKVAKVQKSLKPKDDD